MHEPSDLAPPDARRLRPRSSPIGALGALLGLLAIASLGRVGSSAVPSAGTPSSEPRASGPGAPRASAVGPLDLNRASAAELERLPRIGPSLAARIVADREARGPFRSVAELDRVVGVGPATLAAVSGLVSVE
jgi:competence protein ComEA